jgi:hypothetical protein
LFGNNSIGEGFSFSKSGQAITSNLDLLDAGNTMQGSILSKNIFAVYQEGVWKKIHFTVEQ